MSWMVKKKIHIISIYILNDLFRLKDQLLSGGDEDIIILKDIFNDYQKLFGSEKPLGMKEFYTVLKIAFPQPPSVEESVTNSATPLDTVLQNVRYSPTRRRDGKDCQHCAVYPIHNL